MKAIPFMSCQCHLDEFSFIMDYILLDSGLSLSELDKIRIRDLSEVAFSQMARLHVDYAPNMLEMNSRAMKFASIFID